MSNPNPMNSRCGLEDCDCGYVIDSILSKMHEIRDMIQEFDEAECPDRHPDCPCYEQGLQEGEESERRPVGA